MNCSCRDKLAKTLKNSEIVKKLQNNQSFAKWTATTMNFLSKIFALFLILLPACGKEEKKEPSKIDLTAIKEKADLYSILIQTQSDQSGFIHTDECDSILFSSLKGISVNLDILEARDENGRWHRRPLTYEPCYPDHSKSTISRDMLIGVMWYAFSNARLDIAEELFQYGEKNNWIMGEGDVTRIYFTPNLQATLADLIYKLGGENHYVYRNLPRSWPEGLTGFELHLQILHIELFGQLNGFIDKNMVDVVKGAFKRQPENPLISFVYSKYVDSNVLWDCVQDLKNEKYWPSDRLPTNRDRKEPWLFQRDSGTDWEPDASGEVKTHSGGDFLFLSKLIMDYVK